MPSKNSLYHNVKWSFLCHHFNTVWTKNNRVVIPREATETKRLVQLNINAYSYASGNILTAFDNLIL